MSAMYLVSRKEERRVQLRTRPAQTHEPCNTPRYDHVQRECLLDPLHLRQLQRLNPAGVLQDIEVHFDLPPRSVPVNEFDERIRISRFAVGHKTPDNGLSARWRIHLARLDAGECDTGPPGQRDALATQFLLHFTRLLATASRQHEADMAEHITRVHLVP